MKKTSSATNILFLGIGLSLFGLLAIYNASVIEAFTDFSDKYYFVKRQAVFIAIGGAFFFFFSNLSLRYIKKFSPFFFALSILSLILVLIPGVGLRLQGARRWLSLGFFSIQPSEPFKLFLVIYLSSWLGSYRKLSHFLSLLGLSLALLMLQPDLGTAVIVGSLSLIIYYLSGAPNKQLLLLLSTALILGGFFIFSSPYRLARLQTFLDPTADPLGSSYHINQILLSLGSGGWSGVGLGKSIQKYSYLPEATTDSIFAVLAEELGFLGSAILIIILFGFSIYCFSLSLKAKDSFTRLLVAGISTFFSLQVFVNLAAMVALIPLTGIPLPFISYGGSSLITNFIALGILAQATKSSKL